jgi:choline dehydrogenase-like flavoprotein
MILDLKTMNAPVELSCDLCVVGSGAAGLAIASEMMGTRIKTVIVESGGLEHEPPTQALYDVDISGLPHPGATEGRFRICGGSTTRWGGQALPLMPLDFERREWVPHSGWPISFGELSTYYVRACQFLLVDNLNFDSDLFAHLRTRPPAFDAHRVWYHFSKWSPKPSVREHHLPNLGNSDGCTLLLHANVTGVVLDGNLNRAETIEVCSLAGQKANVRARAFVLCVGGIETARLLLTNDKQQPNGIGNEHDLVGRFFQDHPSAMIGWLKTWDPAGAQRLLNVFHKNGLKYSVRCTATPQWQQQHQTLNVSMGTTFVDDGSALQDVKDVYTALRRGQISGSVARKLLRTVRHPAAALLPAWYFLAHGRSFAPGAHMRIGLTSEQEPNPESRILLSDRTDALGIRRSNVRWKLTELTRHTIRQFAAVLHEEFRRARIGDIELDEWVLDDAQPWTDHLTDQFHHIGTARMNDSPRLGVVDRNCQIHGVANLYVGSSAVFPTSGHSNPTLTIIALCMRLADRLKDELA